MGYCMIYFLFNIVLISTGFLLFPYIFTYWSRIRTRAGDPGAPCTGHTTNPPLPGRSFSDNIAFSPKRQGIRAPSR